jgi:type IV pilus assembly protein PilE
VIKNRGFTLIELMVVVAIVAILAALAYPSFNEQVRASRRADAFSALGDVQLQLERHRADNPTYAGAAVGFPASSHYDFAVTAADAVSYTLSATPTGAQSGDRCGTLSVTFANGAVTRDASGTNVDRCWR